MNTMEKIKQLLYILTNEGGNIDLTQNQIVLAQNPYGTKVEITNLIDNVLTIDFITVGSSQIVKTKSTVEEMKDFLCYYYQHKMDMDNERVIEEVGNELYQTWVREDLEILRTSYVNQISGNKTISVNNSSVMDIVLEIEKPIKRGILTEMMRFPRELSPKYSIGYIPVTCGHFQPVGDKFHAQQIKLYIPMCDLENYPIISQNYKTNYTIDGDGAFQELLATSSNESLQNVLQYINLDNTLGTKNTSAKKNKI